MALSGTCQSCKGSVALGPDLKPVSRHRCGGGAPAQRNPTPPWSPWSAALKATCGRGHRHDSKLEGRLCGIVHAEAGADERVYVRARVPLWALGPDETGKPASYITPDFLVLGPGPDGRPQIRRCYDAKGRRSREWARGAAAFAASYGVRIEEVGSCAAK